MTSSDWILLDRLTIFGRLAKEVLLIMLLRFLFGTGRLAARNLVDKLLNRDAFFRGNYVLSIKLLHVSLGKCVGVFLDIRAISDLFLLSSKLSLG